MYEYGSLKVSSLHTFKMATTTHTFTIDCVCMNRLHLVIHIKVNISPESKIDSIQTVIKFNYKNDFHLMHRKFGIYTF